MCAVLLERHIKKARREFEALLRVTIVNHLHLTFITLDL